MNENRVCDGKVDLCYIIDMSGSIGISNWPIVLEFFRAITSFFTIGENDTLVGVVVFSTDAEVRLRFNDCPDNQCVDDFLANLNYSRGRTNTQAALKLAYNDVLLPGNGNRSDIPDVCLMFTDGMSNEFQEETVPSGEKLKDLGCTLYVVALGEAVKNNETELRALASDPDDEHLIFTPTTNFSVLLDAIEPVAEGTCKIALPPVNQCRCTKYASDGPRKRRYVAA